MFLKKHKSQEEQHSEMCVSSPLVSQEKVSENELMNENISLHMQLG